MWYEGPLSTSDDECAYFHNAIPFDKPLSVNCSPVRFGCHVFVQKTDAELPDSLTICEINVFGKKCKISNFILFIITVLYSTSVNKNKHSVIENTHHIYMSVLSLVIDTVTPAVATPILCL